MDGMPLRKKVLNVLQLLLQMEAVYASSRLVLFYFRFVFSISASLLVVFLNVA